MSGEILQWSRASTACVETVPDVLETMFFESLAEAPELSVLPPAEPLDTSRVDFDGSVNGYLVLAAPSGLSASLAGAFLALDDQGASAYNIEFVLGELANILCGSALGHLQPDGTFRLSTPITHLERILAEPSRPGFQWVRFPLDSGPLFVGLRLEASE